MSMRSRVCLNGGATKREPSQIHVRKSVRWMNEGRRIHTQKPATLTTWHDGLGMNDSAFPFSSHLLFMSLSLPLSSWSSSFTNHHDDDDDVAFPFHVPFYVPFSFSFPLFAPFHSSAPVQTCTQTRTQTDSAPDSQTHSLHSCIHIESKDIHSLPVCMQTYTRVEKERGFIPPSPTNPMTKFPHPKKRTMFLFVVVETWTPVWLLTHQATQSHWRFPSSKRRKTQSYPNTQTVSCCSFILLSVSNHGVLGIRKRTDQMIHV